MLAKRASAVVLPLFGLIASMTLIAPTAHAAAAKVAGKDRLTGVVAGTANIRSSVRSRLPTPPSVRATALPRQAVV